MNSPLPFPILAVASLAFWLFFQNLQAASIEEPAELDKAALKLGAAAALASYVAGDPQDLEQEAVDYLKAQGYTLEWFSTKSPVGVAKESRPQLTYVPDYDLAAHKQRYQAFVRSWDEMTKARMDAQLQRKTSLVGTQTLVAKHGSENRVIIAFRGSDNIANWVADGMVWPVYFPDTKLAVHFGFSLYWLEATHQKDFQEWWKNHVDAETEIVISGHSLGAAVAVLYAAGLLIEEEMPGERIALMTFAEPAPGQYGFAQYLNQQLGNYVAMGNILDPVCYSTTFFGYYHFGISKLMISASEGVNTHSMKIYYQAAMEL